MMHSQGHQPSHAWTKWAVGMLSMDLISPPAIPSLGSMLWGHIISTRGHTALEYCPFAPGAYSPLSISSTC